MAHIDADLLTPVAARLVARSGTALSPAERTEVLRIAQGLACKESALASGISYETIRARRKRIYRKLGLGGSGELLSSLLGDSLQMLTGHDAVAPPPALEASSQGSAH